MMHKHFKLLCDNWFLSGE